MRKTVSRKKTDPPQTPVISANASSTALTNVWKCPFCDAPIVAPAGQAQDSMKKHRKHCPGPEQPAIYKKGDPLFPLRRLLGGTRLADALIEFSGRESDGNNEDQLHAANVFRMTAIGIIREQCGISAKLAYAYSEAARSEENSGNIEMALYCQRKAVVVAFLSKVPDDQTDEYLLMLAHCAIMKNEIAEAGWALSELFTRLDDPKWSWTRFSVEIYSEWLEKVGQSSRRQNFLNRMNGSLSIEAYTWFLRHWKAGVLPRIGALMTDVECALDIPVATPTKEERFRLIEREQKESEVAK